MEFKLSSMRMRNKKNLIKFRILIQKRILKEQNIQNWQTQRSMITRKILYLLTLVRLDPNPGIPRTPNCLSRNLLMKKVWAVQHSEMLINYYDNIKILNIHLIIIENKSYGFLATDSKYFPDPLLRTPPLLIHSKSTSLIIIHSQSTAQENEFLLVRSLSTQPLNQNHNQIEQYRYPKIGN